MVCAESLRALASLARCARLGTEPPHRFGFPRFSKIRCDASDSLAFGRIPRIPEDSRGFAGLARIPQDSLGFPRIR